MDVIKLIDRLYFYNYFLLNNQVRIIETNSP
jgi:hypothetical protein